MLLLIALSAKSQDVTEEDSVKVYRPTLAMIMSDLDKLEVCLIDVQNLRLGYNTCKEERNILRGVANTLYIKNKELTEELNNTAANNEQLKKKRIIWGITGFAVGIVTTIVISNQTSK